MPKVTFKDDGIEAEVENGARLADAADEVEASIDFSCRQGMCSTCIINVVEGQENLKPAEEPEVTTLVNQGAAENERLACQCVVQGDVVIEKA